MTREEAINYLEDAKIKFKIPKSAVTARKTNEALDMAMKALEQEPCEDCISREQAKSAIRDRFKDLPSRVEINTILNELPSVTPEKTKDEEVHEYSDKSP